MDNESGEGGEMKIIFRIIIGIIAIPATILAIPFFILVRFVGYPKGFAYEPKRGKEE